MLIIPGVDKRCIEILDEITCRYAEILQENLVGIYVHGSIAFGCFNWDQSDIDFIVVVKEQLPLHTKEELIQMLIRLKKIAPSKGFEMSVVLLEHCLSFCYPTPFLLHFSNSMITECEADLFGYCKTMHGTDKDLAAHFTVIKKVGVTLCGKEIKDVFGIVPEEDYIDSIKMDISNAVEGVLNNPVYFILNLCRILAYLTEGIILSKAQGGEWGLENIPDRFSPTIKAALNSYRQNKKLAVENKDAQEFCKYMLNKTLRPF